MPQSIISSMVRRQPVHSLVCSCMTQTPMHGVGSGPAWVSGLNGARTSVMDSVFRALFFFVELGVELVRDDDRALMLALADLVVTIPGFDAKTNPTAFDSD